MATAKLFIEASDTVIRDAGYLIAFHNWVDATGYEASCRKVLTDYVMNARRQIRAVHILARSRVMVMGINVANIALGNFIKAYHSETAFNSALEEAVKQPFR